MLDTFDPDPLHETNSETDLLHETVSLTDPGSNKLWEIHFLYIFFNTHE